MTKQLFGLELEMSELTISLEFVGWGEGYIVTALLKATDTDDVIHAGRSLYYSEFPDVEEAAREATAGIRIWLDSLEDAE